MADVQIKPEIKVDPATSTNTAMADIDEFEDDNDLFIPPPPGPEGNGPQAWLVKVPKYIWEAWAEIYRDAPDDGGNIEIGKMRVYDALPGQDSSKQKTQICLAPKVPQHLDLPKTYNLDIKTTGYSNTVVFSEKDLPGHKSSRPPFTRALKPRGIPPKSERYGTNNKTKIGNYRTAIPKETALAPLIYHVADAAPEEDDSYIEFFKKSYQASIQPKKTTNFTSTISRSMHPSASHLNAFSSFGITSRPRGSKKAAPKEKAVRIDQTALLDAIYRCFRKYRYWPLKALRNELRQPEAYIKQTLEGIATLVRSGDFAMNYKLRDEYEDMQRNMKGGEGEAKVEPKEETAVVKSEVEESEMDLEGSEDIGDDDDVGEEFEDVRMDGS